MFSMSLIQIAVISGSCADNEFECPQGICIPKVYLCDNYPDCYPYFSDELRCGGKYANLTHSLFR